MKIYFAWYQGLDAAPGLVKIIHRLWQKSQPRHEVELLTAREMDAIIAREGIDPSPLTMQVRTNITRICLLADRGGIWTDATVLPAAPLEDWLIGRADQEGFFAFRNPGPDRLLSNWFLLSEAGHPITRRWRDLYVDYFRTPRRFIQAAPREERQAADDRIRTDPASFAAPEVAGKTPYYPYFIMHYHFAYALQTDSECAHRWEQVPQMDATLPQRLAWACIYWQRLLDPARIAALYEAAPLHKLKWREGCFDEALKIASSRFL